MIEKSSTEIHSNFEQYERLEECQVTTEIIPKVIHPDIHVILPTLVREISFVMSFV